MDNISVNPKRPTSNMKRNRVAGNVFTYIFLVLVSIIWILPFILLFTNSLRGETSGPYVATLFPQIWSFKNYIALFTDKTYTFIRWYLNTLIVALFTAVVQTLGVLMTSYAFSRLRFKGRRFMMKMILILGMFPGFMSMIAVYFILKALGMTGNLSLVGMFLTYIGGSAMQYYIAKGYFDTISKSLDEAAKIDGASKHQIFKKIIMPLSKPIIVYTILMAFMAPWGDFMFASIIAMGDLKVMNVAVGLYEMLKKEQINSYYSVFCAGGVFVSIPIAILFFCLQKYYVEGITGGSVKG